MSAPPSSERHTFDEFCDKLAAALVVTPDLLKKSRSVATDLQLDELSLVVLVIAIQDMNPYFEVPDQMSWSDLSIHDLFHYYEVMGEGHFEIEQDHS